MSIQEIQGNRQTADLVPVPGLTDPYSYIRKVEYPRGNLTDLSIIGVPDNCQGRNPTVQAFPERFNDLSRGVWVSMIGSPEYQAKVRVWGSLDLVWHNTLQEFLGLCEDQGIFPFNSSMNASENETVKDFIRRARIWIVQYADDCGLFERMKVRKAFREYVRKDHRMVLISWADMYPLNDDVASGFEKWLMTSPSPRMYKLTNNKYVKYIRPHVRMWVRYINRYRVRVGFEIDIAGQVQVPQNKTATKDQVDAFMDHNIYFPLVRSLRFKHVRTRLF